jgi:hypothetical protein
MSYSTEINSNKVDVPYLSVDTFIKHIGGTVVDAGAEKITGPNNGRYSPLDYERGYMLRGANNYDVRINGKDFKIKNTESNKPYYNTYDLIAAATAAGVSADKIRDGLAAAKITPPKTLTNSKGWTTTLVQQANTKTIPAASSLQTYLNQMYPGAGLRVVVNLKKDGSGYETQVLYTNAEGRQERFDADGFNTFDNVPTSEDLNNAFGVNTTYYSKFKQHSASAIAAQNQINTGYAALDALGYKVDENGNVISTGNLGSQLNTSNDLTAQEWASIIADLPDTADLKAWNQSKDANIFNNIFKNTPNTKPDLAERKSLQDLQDLTSVVTKEQQDTTQRNIDSQRLQLLRQIKNDPELYNAITQQLRADNAAGTIAGQRAANAQQLATQADADYDKAASDLYSSLFTGENAAVDATRNNILTERTGTLDQYVTGQLNNLIEAAKQGQINSEDLVTFADALSLQNGALGVDVTNFGNKVTNAATDADATAQKYADRLTGQSTVGAAQEDAKVKAVMDRLGISQDYLQTAANGGADVSAALNTIMKNFNTGSLGGGYKTVTAPDIKEAELFDNKQYDDFINSGAIDKWLSDETIKAFTEDKSLQQLLNEYGLGDTLTEAGLSALYKGYAEEANKESDKVFNQAQRAYIAAVTAGDTKTTEQLSKLAANAGSSKGNLLASSALANQYKQQLGMNNTGRQLATDYQNQASQNLAAVAKAGLDANKALTKYLGNGTDNYESGTVYGALNTIKGTAASNRGIYGNIGSDIMSATKNLNTDVNRHNVNNNTRATNLASHYTLGNASNAANNVKNKGTAGTIATNALAMIAQGKATK